MKNILNCITIGDIDGVGIELISKIWKNHRKKTGPFFLLGNYNLINNKLKDSNIQKYQRFVPHLTIARVKKCEDNKYIQEVIEKYKNIIFGQEKINKIKLKKSILTSNGPIYSNLHVLNMNGGENERT